MSTPAREKDSKTWLIWLALGVALALVGPTWLFNWKFNPATAVPEPTPQEEAAESPTPTESDAESR